MALFVDTALDAVLVQDVVDAFALAIDARSWERARARLADEVDFDNTALGGSRDTVRADDLVAQIRTHLEPLDATAHMLSTHHVSVGGAEARCMVQAQAHHRYADATYTIYSRQRYILTRHADSWRISGVAMDLAFTTGPSDVFTRAASQVAADTDRALDSQDASHGADRR